MIKLVPTKLFNPVMKQALNFVMCEVLGCKKMHSIEAISVFYIALLTSILLLALPLLLTFKESISIF